MLLVNPGDHKKMIGVTLVLVLVLFQAIGVSLAQAPLAAEARVDVLINGRLFPSGGVVEGDRTFVRLADVAESIDARYMFDAAIGVAFVQSGTYAHLNWQKMTELNPKLRRWYAATEPHSGTAGHEYVASPGSSLGVVTSPAGEVLAFNFAIAADREGHFPWFDQAVDAPIEGVLYTQHLYVVDPALVRSLSSARPGGVQVAFNGEALDLPDDALRWYDGDLYVRLRDVARASGGGVGWNVVTRTASAKIVPGDELIGFKLIDLNSNMDDYEMVGDFAPGVGMAAAVPGPGIYVTFGGDWRVATFFVVLDAAVVDWAPWFDQGKNQPETSQFGTAYTIHHYILPFDEIEAP